MEDFKIEDILDDETRNEIDKLARLHELCRQLIAIEGELRSDHNIGLEIIELDHV